MTIIFKLDKHDHYHSKKIKFYELKHFGVMILIQNRPKKKPKICCLDKQLVEPYNRLVKSMPKIILLVEFKHGLVE